jgi:predicted CoA-binding protein
MPVEDDDTLRAILGLERIAVIGASTDYDKAAHIVPAFLQRKGYEVVPVNPRAEEVFGRAAYDSLVDIDEEIDIVQIFRPSDEVAGIVDQAIARDDVQVIWMQLRIRDTDAARKAERAGPSVVQDRCMKIEYGMLMR